MLKDRLIRARKYRKLTQNELAELCGLDQARVSAYERGIRNPKSDTLQKIASALKLQLYYNSGFAFFYDAHQISYDASNDEEANRKAFNYLQEKAARDEAGIQGFDTPEEFEKAWLQAGGGKHTGRPADLARLELNEQQLDDTGIAKLADYSDDLVSSGKYKKK